GPLGVGPLGEFRSQADDGGAIQKIEVRPLRENFYPIRKFSRILTCVSRLDQRSVIVQRPLRGLFQVYSGKIMLHRMSGRRLCAARLPLLVRGLAIARDG